MTSHLTTSRNLCQARCYSNTTNQPSHWYSNATQVRRAWVLHCCKTENQLHMQPERLCTEMNYAQIEKELLAIVFGVERFNQYTYRRKVAVDLDHKPLETIFRKSLATAPDASKRCSCVSNVMILTYITRRDLKCTWRIRSADTSMGMKYTWSGKSLRKRSKKCQR